MRKKCTSYKKPELGLASVNCFNTQFVPNILGTMPVLEYHDFYISV